MATKVGLHNVAFKVDNLHEVVSRLAAGMYGLAGGIGEHHNGYLMTYVRGREGIIVALADA